MDLQIDMEPEDFEKECLKYSLAQLYEFYKEFCEDIFSHYSLDGSWCSREYCRCFSSNMRTLGEIFYDCIDSYLFPSNP